MKILQSFKNREHSNKVPFEKSVYETNFVKERWSRNSYQNIGKVSSMNKFGRDS